MLSAIIQNALMQHLTPPPISILYASTLVLSFIGMVPIIYGILFRLEKQMRRSDWFAFITIGAPWILLSIVGVLLSVGIKLF
jgi:hypothetical protein